MHAFIHHQLQVPVNKNMIRHAWYAAKLTTACEVPCNVNQAAFPAEVKPKNVSAASKHSLDAQSVKKFCVFAVFTMSIIPNPESLLP
jgi:hypothetical protein